MVKNFTILISIILVGSVATTVHAGRLKKLKPLADGFVLTGDEGALSSEANSKWFFEFDSDLKSQTGLVRAGTKLEILTSAGLEKMTADAAQHTGATYKIWGQVTKYRDKNFIFPLYFLPIEKTEFREPSNTQQRQGPAINEPDDELAIPDEIIAKLKPVKIIRTVQLRKGLELKQDSILADRTGFITTRPDGDAVFVLDSLGRNFPEISIHLLPCQALEYAQNKQTSELEQVRFKVAGVVTRYKNKNYMLLHRARRIYSHGNFGK